MNSRYILKKIKPYLNEKGKLGKEDFKNLFSAFERDQQLKILKILIENKISIDCEDVLLKTSKSINRVKKDEQSINYKSLINLTNEQLCVIYQKGNQNALSALIYKNTGLVASEAIKFEKYYKHKLDKEDLIQYGTMGLIKATKRFSLDKEAKFTTYSMYWIDQFILRSIADYGFTVRIPVHMFELVNTVVRVMRKYPNYSRKELFEIFKEKNINSDKFEEILRIKDQILSIRSINSLVGEDKNTELVEFIPDEDMISVEEEVQYKMLQKDLDRVLETLTEREEKIIRLRFGLDDGRERTLEEIGNEFNVTRERIRQIESKALRRLRHPSRSTSIKNYL